MVCDEPFTEGELLWINGQAVCICTERWTRIFLCTDDYDVPRYAYEYWRHPECKVHPLTFLERPA